MAFDRPIRVWSPAPGTLRIETDADEKELLRSRLLSEVVGGLIFAAFVPLAVKSGEETHTVTTLLFVAVLALCYVGVVLAINRAHHRALRCWSFPLADRAASLFGRRRDPEPAARIPFADIQGVDVRPTRGGTASEPCRLILRTVRGSHPLGILGPVPDPARVRTRIEQFLGGIDPGSAPTSGAGGESGTVALKAPRSDALRMAGHGLLLLAAGCLFLGIASRGDFRGWDAARIPFGLVSGLLFLVSGQLLVGALRLRRGKTVVERVGPRVLIRDGSARHHEIPLEGALELVAVMKVATNPPYFKLLLRARDGEILLAEAAPLKLVLAWRNGLVQLLGPRLLA